MRGTHLLQMANTSTCWKTELNLSNLVPCAICYIYASKRNTIDYVTRMKFSKSAKKTLFYDPGKLFSTVTIVEGTKREKILFFALFLKS